MPTVTVVRVKSLITGALNSYLEVKDNFGAPTAVTEDTIFKQLKKRPIYKDGARVNPDVAFCSGFPWTPLFGHEATRSYHH
jgi:hypothetical protein